MYKSLLLRFVLKQGGRSGVYLRRQDHDDARPCGREKRLYLVNACRFLSAKPSVITASKFILLNDHSSIFLYCTLMMALRIGRYATWENGPPKTLTASRRRRGVDSVKCIIEKIETHSIIVDWITSPSSTKTPSKTIPKQELSKITRINPSANPRPNACDRVKVIPDGMSTVSTFKEFFSDLTEQYGGRFKKLNAREVEALSTPCENCSKALQRDLKQSTTTAKAAKIARLSDSETKESECVSSRCPSASEAPVSFLHFTYSVFISEIV
ncbi:hypothetical protein ANCCAN_11217 [Ancylostoma caninum]|uniref:Uncharacterized protein n=1 Tax=Ancylostoma caninum TaxID=29170 RepID=A0A368GHV4_ANCCA|nr:hypothetical protein ANCCAN_11217 [Ancylostoma caninum]